MSLSACGAWWCSLGTCGRGPRPPSVPPHNPRRSPPQPPRTPATAYTGHADSQPPPATEKIFKKNLGSIVYQTQQQHGIVVLLQKPHKETILYSKYNSYNPHLSTVYSKFISVIAHTESALPHNPNFDHHICRKKKFTSLIAVNFSPFLMGFCNSWHKTSQTHTPWQTLGMVGTQGPWALPPVLGGQGCLSGNPSGSGRPWS